MSGFLIVSWVISNPYFSSLFKSSQKEVVVSNELVEIVEQWSEFKEICKRNKLNEAVKKLDEIFPILINTENNNERS